MKLGIQLYSVRDCLKNDFTGTIKALVEMGFEGVEFAGDYGGTDPAETAAKLKAAGLVCCGMHTGIPALLDASSNDYRYAAAVAAPFASVSCCGPSNIADWSGTIASVAGAARAARARGLRFSYHNHAQELEIRGGKTLLDTLYAETSAAEVEAELDTAWIHAGGGDPVAFIRRYAGRVPQVHAKDYSRADKRLVEIGRGDLDFAAIVAAARDAGAEWLIYELDNSTIGDSMASAREASAILRPLVGA